jgi:hypothetical protein
MSDRRAGLDQLARRAVLRVIRGVHRRHIDVLPSVGADAESLARAKQELGEVEQELDMLVLSYDWPFD